MAIINFKVSKTEFKIINEIVRRAAAMARDNGNPIEDLQGFEMDITACHANGCPLQLDELLHADDFNFAHDVFGIHRHLDRKTGKLTDCFLPRYAEPE